MFNHWKDLALKNLYLVLRSNTTGLGAIFNEVLTAILYYEYGLFRGLEIDFGKTGHYYDENQGDNWWSYFFEPISLGEKKNTLQIEGVFSPYYFILDYCFKRKEVYQTVQKHIKLKKHLQAKIDQYHAPFSGYFVIGVHYRGKEKENEAPTVPYEEVASVVRGAMKPILARNVECKIFLATDEGAFFDFMLSQFPQDLLSIENVMRTKTPGENIVFTNPNRYELGEHALMDAILLSKTNLLIKTESNLNMIAEYMNPGLPVIKLNQRRFDFNEELVTWIKDALEKGREGSPPLGLFQYFWLGGLRVLQ